MANTFYFISRVEVTTPTQSIQFTSIPNTYTDLLLIMSIRQNANADGHQLGVRFNSNGSNYGRLGLYYVGNATDVAGGNSETFARFGFAESSTFTSNTFGSYEMYITNYASTNEYKPFQTHSVCESNSTVVYAQGLWSGIWNNTSAINSITIQDLSNNTDIATNSTAYLYGIKNS
jgi:hypothetical protein